MATTVDTAITLPGKKFEHDSKPHKANVKSLEDTLQSFFAQLVPVGGIIAYAGGTAPAGWLPCDSSEASRSVYTALHAVMQAAGYPYGDGDGASTFTLPPTTAVTHDANTRLIIKV